MEREAYIKKMKEETTFIFAGHNIKWFAVLAIESLIDCCRIKRENVWYFDDNSTDGTREELVNRKIHVISWDPTIYNTYINSSYRDDICIRVDQIVASIIRQIKTKYVCYLDGDTVYNADAIGHFFSIIYDNTDENQTCDFVGMQRSLSKTKKEYVPSKMDRNIRQHLLWVNVKKAKQKKLLDNNPVKYDKFANGYEGFNKYIETGFLVYNALMEANDITYYIPYDDIINQTLCYDYFHVEWLSSSRRNDEMYNGNWEEKRKMLDEVVDKHYKLPCEKYGVPFGVLKKSMNDTFRKSNIC